MTKAADRVDIAIIGAGVVGLAVAERLSRRTADIAVVERNESFGRETSSRNSEVIHAGLYYAEHLLKTRLCVRGNPLLYELCAAKGIPHRKSGKIVLAADETEIAALERIHRQAQANGVPGVRLLARREVLALEPRVSAAAGLFSPESGIVDSHSLMAYLERSARERGAVIAYGCEVVGVQQTEGGYSIEVREADGSAMRLEASILVNSAGLGADRIAALAGIDVDAAGYRIRPCKGEYFSLAACYRGSFQHLIYPLPSPVHLGAHLVLSLDGGLKIGPNAFWVDRIDYRVDPEHRVEFHRLAHRLLPFLAPEDLAPDMAGIRPKLYREGEAFRDFVIREESDRGLPGLIDLIGIESPGLTSCLTIAERVEELIWRAA